MSSNEGGILKSGEGSRGGKIIGHTHSGHPIYAPGHAHYTNVPGVGESSKGSKIREFQAFSGALRSRYKGFSPLDHMEAARQHMQHATAATHETDRHRSAAKPEAVNWSAVVAAHTKRLGHEHASLAHFAAAGHENPYQAMRDAQVTKSLCKSEGSRGGKVIGHTRSGKAVYLKKAAKSYSDFSPDDHDDAEKLHRGQFDRHVAGMEKASKQIGQNRTHAALLLFESHHRNGLLQRNRAGGHEIAARMKRRDTVKKSEGARGGHVIGHTKSGKPVYGHRHVLNAVITLGGKNNGSLPPKLEADLAETAYPSFSAADHADARELHIRYGKSPAISSEHQRVAMRIASAHSRAASHLSQQEKSEGLTKAEGSRGGHIVGHTRSGKPIYDTRHSANHAVVSDAHRQNHEQGIITSSGAVRQAHLGFTKADHLDAADHHARVAAQTHDHDERRDSHALAQAHAVASMMMKKPKDTDASPGEGPALKKAEGERGGHVIGHTKTGKPIYQSSQGATGRLSHLGVRGYSAGDHADAIAVHTALLSSGLPEEHAAGARKAIAYHQKKSGQAPSPAPPTGIQAAVAHPGTPLPAAAAKAPAQNPARALTSIAARMGKLKTDDAAISSGQYRKEKKAFDAHALKVHGQHFGHMTAEQHLAAAQDHTGLNSKSGADREKARVARTAHGAMAHALFARQRASARTTPPPATTVIHGLPPRAPAPQQTAKSISAADLQDQETVTVETPAETIKLVDRLVQNMRLAGLDVEVEGTSDGGYSIRRRLGGQPVEIRPDGAVRAPEALILFALGDDQALAKAGIAMPSLPAAPKPPAVPAAPKVVAPRPAGNAVLGKTSTGGTIWAQAKADSPVYRGFSPRDHAQAANMHQLAGNHDAAGAHRAMHAKLTAPKAPALPAAALAARPRMGIGRMAMSDRRKADMVKWESQDVLGDWLGKGKGEGAHGGRVIGHTKGGKPVYAAHGAEHPDYRRFTRQDHSDAADHHQWMANTLKRVALVNPSRSVASRRAAYGDEQHEDRAATHQSAGLRLKKAGLMSMFSKPKLPAMPSVAPPHVAAVHPPTSPGAPAAGGHGGEGSKGGQVVGHTQSGKPIYSAMHANNYKKFSMGEHSEASLVHGALSHAAHVAGNKDLASHHANMRLNHVRSMQRLSGSPTMATGFNTGAPVRQQRARRASLKKPAADAPAATQAEA